MFFSSFFGCFGCKKVTRIYHDRIRKEKRNTTIVFALTIVVTCCQKDGDNRQDYFEEKQHHGTVKYNISRGRTSLQVKAKLFLVIRSIIYNVASIFFTVLKSLQRCATCA
jgi:hypothetical protein